MRTPKSSGSGVALRIRQRLTIRYGCSHTVRVRVQHTHAPHKSHYTAPRTCVNGILYLVARNPPVAHEWWIMRAPRRHTMMWCLVANTLLVCVLYLYMVLRSSVAIFAGFGRTVYVMSDVQTHVWICKTYPRTHESRGVVFPAKLTIYYATSTSTSQKPVTEKPTNIHKYTTHACRNNKLSPFMINEPNFTHTQSTHTSATVAH